MKMLCITLLLSALFVSCNKTGVYGFKEGETYIYKNDDRDEPALYKVTKVTMDYVVFTKEGETPPSPQYNYKLTGHRLKSLASSLKVAD